MASVSIVIPAHNEAPILRQCCEQITQVMEQLRTPYEIIIVDDGSTDGTAQCIQELHRRVPQIRGLVFSRNFGQQPALIAGMRHARGDAVITMDADLQHPPSLLPEMIRCWKEGHNIVYTIREHTDDVSWLKKSSSKFFYRIFNLMCERSIPANAADFRLLDRRVVDTMALFPERSFFLRELAEWIGFSQVGIPYRAGKRGGGTTKNTLKKMGSMAIHHLFLSSTVPLRLILTMGILCMALSMVYGFVILGRWASGSAIPGWTSVILSVNVFGSLMLISIGIVGKYLAIIFHEMKRRPLYIIAEQIGSALPDHDEAACDSKIFAMAGSAVSTR